MTARKKRPREQTVVTNVMCGPCFLRSKRVDFKMVTDGSLVALCCEPERHYPGFWEKGEVPKAGRKRAEAKEGE